jgi:cell division septation protein DedD
MMSWVGNLTVKDRRALLLYLGVVLLCAACFASGLFVGHTAQPSQAAEKLRQPEAGFTLRVMGLGSAEEAARLSAVLRERGHPGGAIDTASGEPGYAVKIGPFTTRAAADDLTSELRNAGYGAVRLVAETPDRR